MPLPAAGQRSLNRAGVRAHAEGLLDPACQLPRAQRGVGGRASKNSLARNSGSVTCSGSGFRQRASASAASFGSVPPSRCLAGRDHHERVRRHGIGPPSRQREQLPVLVVQVDPVLPPVLPVGDELEVAAGQRMERVRHTDTPVPIMWIRCS